MVGFRLVADLRTQWHHSDDVSVYDSFAGRELNLLFGLPWAITIFKDGINQDDPSFGPTVSTQRLVSRGIAAPFQIDSPH